MDKNIQELASEIKSKSSRLELKQQRIDELLNSCKDEVLKQIIGPFGLTPAMFDDKNGGNVTTTHNFEQGIVATDEDQTKFDGYQERKEMKWEDRRKAYDQNSKPIRSNNKSPDAPKIVDGYTGEILEKDKHAHYEHITPVKEIETNTGLNLRMTLEERIALANSPENTTYTKDIINTKGAGGENPAKNDKDLMKYYNSLSDEQKLDLGLKEELVKQEYIKSKRHVSKEHAKKWIEKDGKELLQTGAEEAGRNALRQAMGLILHELVNSSFIEVKRIANDPMLKENFVDHLIEAIRNVIEKIKDKAEHILKSVLSGGVQGFISNLLTFIINNIVTTSAKIVTVIREGLKGLWEAVKLIMSPPKDMSGIDVARKASKIIATVITTSLGIIFEKSIEAFILSIPILAPLAPFISPVITGLLTGIVTALVIFAIDKLFDWLNESGTEMFNAQIEHMEANRELFERMAQMLQAQFSNSKQYQFCIVEYNQIEVNLYESTSHLNNAIFHVDHAISVRTATLLTMKEGFSNFKSMDDELDTLLLAYEQDKKDN